MSKIRVGILMGGHDFDRVQSLETGERIIQEIDSSRYEPFPLVIPPQSSPKDIHEALKIASRQNRIDVVFITLRDHWNQSDSVQAMCESLGLAYTGSDALACARGKDQVFCKKCLSDAGFFVPISYEVSKERWQHSKDEVLERIYCYLGLPCVVRNPLERFHPEISVVKEDVNLLAAIEARLINSDRIVIEDFIMGDYISCGVLGSETEEIEPLSVVESHHFSELNPTAADPSPLSKEMIRKAQRVAQNAHRQLNFSGISHFDLILRKSLVYVLGVDTVPDFTPDSLLSRSIQTSALKLKDVLHRIILAGLKRGRSNDLTEPTVSSLVTLRTP